jgi:hypothetical protein
MKGRGTTATGRSKRKDQFVPVAYGMAHSPAWRSLTGSAVKVYIELRSRYNGGNNGRLTLSLDEGSRLLGLGKATVRRAFLELETKGFVRCTKRGRWYGRLASEYAVSDRSHDGLPPANLWSRWQPSGSLETSVSVLGRIHRCGDGATMEPER